MTTEQILQTAYKELAIAILGKSNNLLKINPIRNFKEFEVRLATYQTVKKFINEGKAELFFP